MFNCSVPRTWRIQKRSEVIREAPGKGRFELVFGRQEVSWKQKSIEKKTFLCVSFTLIVLPREFWREMCGVSTYQVILWHQLDIPQFNSILTLSGDSVRSQRLGAWAWPLTSDACWKVVSPHVTHFCLTWLPTGGSSTTPQVQLVC